MKKYKNIIAFSILITLAVLSSLMTVEGALNSSGILQSAGIELSDNKSFIIAIVIIVQMITVSFAIVLDILILYLLTKFILKSNVRLKNYYFAIIIANIINIIINFAISTIIGNDYNVSQRFLISLLSPATVIKVIVLYYLLKNEVFKEQKKNGITVCGIYMIIMYCFAAINYFTLE